MWYGRLATTSYGGVDQADEVLVERVALDRAAGAPPRPRPRTCRAGTRPAPDRARRPSPRRRPRAARRSGSPSPGPISSTRSPGPGRPRAGCPRARRRRRGSSGPGRGAGRRPAVARASCGRSRGSRRRSRPRRRSSGERQRRPRVEVEPGPHARREPPGARPRRSSPRCRCTGPVAGRRAGCPRASASPAIRARRAAFAATPPPSTIPRAPTSSAARIVLVASTSTTESWNPQASSATTGVGQRCRRARRPGRPSSARACADDPAGGRLEAREAQVVRVAGSQARGNTRSFAVAALGRPRDRRPARVAEAEQPADLVERLARRVVDGLAEQPVVEVVAHLDEERVAARHDERDERERRRLVLGLARVEQPARVDVALEVVDRHERLVVRPGERLGDVDARPAASRRARARR